MTAPKAASKKASPTSSKTSPTKKSKKKSKQTENPEQYLGIKLRLKPSKKALKQLEKQFESAVLVHNQLIKDQEDDFLEYRDDQALRIIRMEAHSWQEARKLTAPMPPLNGYVFKYRIKDLRKYHPHLKAGVSQMQQQEAANVEETYIRFLKGEGGKPKMREPGKRKKESIRFPQYVKIDLKKKRIKLTKIEDWIPFYDDGRDLTCLRDIDAATIKREGDKLFACFSYTEICPPPMPLDIEDLSRWVGLDMGIEYLVTTSEGKHYGSMQEKTEPLVDKIITLQRTLKHKTKDSRAYRRTLQLINRCFDQIVNIRHDYVQKITTELVSKYDFIAVEDLTILKMVKAVKDPDKKESKAGQRKRTLNRHIQDANWSYFFYTLDYKLRLKGGRLFKVDPSYTSQKCPICGYTSRRNRPTQEVFCCKQCGYECNADIVGAINILAKGLTMAEMLLKKEQEEQEELF